jgi:hypothetical protein
MPPETSGFHEVPNEPHKGNGGAAPPAELAVWDAGDDPGPIPPRQWLLGNQFCRGFISSIVAAGGVGKSRSGCCNSSHWRSAGRCVANTFFAAAASC